MAQPDRVLFTHDAHFAVAKSEGKPVTLTGYAVVWNSLSQDRGGYRVRMLPNSARFVQPSLVLFNHDYRGVIGSTVSGQCVG